MKWLNKSLLYIGVVITLLIIIVMLIFNYNQHKYNYYDNYGYSHYTRYDLSNLRHFDDNWHYQVPSFKGLNIKNIPSLNQNDENHRTVWDSWPLQDDNGNEITYHGYHLVFALTGRSVAMTPNIQLFYQKVGDENKGLGTWHNAGVVVKSSNNSDTLIKKFENEQWAGSSILENNKIRMFYTSVGNYTEQNYPTAFAKAQLDIKVSKKGITVNPDNPLDHKILLQSDGKYYETLNQSKKIKGDDYGFRDPHYIEDNGRKYIIFQANSGTDDGYQGSKSLSNISNYGGNEEFYNKEKLFLLNNNLRYRSQISNSVIGIAELDNNYNIKKVKKPLLGFNTTNDEIERPNIFKHNGKWYLFGITRGKNFATNDINPDSCYMLGFVSNSLNAPFKPLNRNGLVLSSNTNPNAYDYTYSYLVLNNNNNDDNDFVVTEFMNFKTFGNSFILNINGDKTSVKHNKVMQQGAISEKNAIYYNQSHIRNNFSTFFNH